MPNPLFRLLLFLKSIYQALISLFIVPVWTILICIPLTIFFILIRIKKLVGLVIHIWSKFSFIALGQSYRIEGQENIDPNKRYIIIANHSSILDIIAIGVITNKPLSWVLKESLLYLPGFNLLFLLGVGIPIKRSSARESQSKILKTIKKIKNNLNPHIVIYPEGTRTKTGNINTFKRGFVKIMKEYEMDILPVTLCGFYKFYRSGAFLTDPSSKLKIIIHKPYSFEVLKNMDEKDLSEQMKQIIAEKYYA